jgi:hypothetical protein
MLELLANLTALFMEAIVYVPLSIIDGLNNYFASKAWFQDDCRGDSPPCQGAVWELVIWLLEDCITQSVLETSGTRMNIGITRKGGTMRLGGSINLLPVEELLGALTDKITKGP